MCIWVLDVKSLSVCNLHILPVPLLVSLHSLKTCSLSTDVNVSEIGS